MPCWQAGAGTLLLLLLFLQPVLLRLTKVAAGVLSFRSLLRLLFLLLL
jgi:hypothetical protein